MVELGLDRAAHPAARRGQKKVARLDKRRLHTADAGQGISEWSAAPAAACGLLADGRRATPTPIRRCLYTIRVRGRWMGQLGGLDAIGNT